MMKRKLKDAGLICIAGIAVIAVSFLTGCTMEASTDNRSNSDTGGHTTVTVNASHGNR